MFWLLVLAPPELAFVVSAELLAPTREGLITAARTLEYLTNLLRHQPPLQNQILRPLEIANAVHSYDVLVKTTGGGINGQAGALRLALSRALLEVDAALRLPLKQEGLLTRDPRMKERKKPGRPGARKRFQFSKR